MASGSSWRSNQLVDIQDRHGCLLGLVEELGIDISAMQDPRPTERNCPTAPSLMLTGDSEVDSDKLSSRYGDQDLSSQTRCPARRRCPNSF